MTKNDSLTLLKRRVTRWVRQVVVAGLAMVATAIAFAGPDLTVSNLTFGAPTTNQNGSYSFSTSFTVTNIGDAPAPAYWYDRIHLSTNGALSGSVWNTFWSRNSALGPGESYTVSTTVTAGLAPGSYTVLAATDTNSQVAETDETNNTVAGGTIVFKLPDLVVSGVTTGAPVTNEDGSYTFQASFTVTNVGEVPAKSAWYDRIYLTTNGTVASSVWNTYWTRSTDLAPGASYTVTGNVTAGLAPGTYTVVAAADTNQYLAETNEGNNTAVGSTITFKRPDLVVSGVTTGTPVTNQDGSYTFPASFTVTNVGEVPAKPYWYDRIYLTTNGTVASSVWNTYWTRSTELAPGASYNVSGNVTAGLAPGTYTVVAAADTNQSLAETDESNNTAVGSTITFKRPDLVVSAVTTGTPVTNHDGSYTFPASFTVTNVGEVPAKPYWYDRIYLTTNGTVASSVWNTYWTRNTELAPGASYTISSNVTAGPNPGTYTVVAAADTNQSLAETDETNNTAVGSTITFQRSDLTVASVNVGIPSDNPDGSFSIPVTYTVTNVGGAPAVPAWYDRVHFSVDATLDSGDPYVNVSGPTSPVMPGASYTASATFTTSTTTAAGTYTVFANANGSRELGESDLGNNARSAPVTLRIRTQTAVAESSSINPSQVGQQALLTATITPSAATGTVTFQDGSVILGTSAVTNGNATLATAFPSPGTHNVTAAFSGDAFYRPSSVSLAQTVTKASTAVTLSTQSVHVLPNQSVTVNANVSGVNPTGTVTFSDGSALLDTSAVYNGTASLRTSFSATGTHSLTATYSGDANNLSVSSTTLSLEVAANSPGGASAVWQYGYDAADRPSTVVSPTGQATYLHYDSLGRAIQVQQPPNTGATAPTVTQFAYDGRDQVASVSDPRNLSTTYTADGLGNVLATASPDTGTGASTYDAAGNLLTQTDARGKTATYAYDALNRLKAIAYASGVPTTFEYDGGATPVAASAGKLTRMTDESGTTSYTHDAFGRIATKVQNIGGRTFAVGYTWGDSGAALDKLTAISYPSGTRVNYTYDQYGSISGITVNPVNANGQGVSASATTLLSGVTYNVDNVVSGWLWSGGKARTIGFDSNGLISSYNLGDPLGTGNAAGLLRSIQRDAAGRITGYTHTSGSNPASSFDQTFGYDNLDRLTTATQSATTTQYSYDDTGNRTAKTIGGTTYTNTISTTSNRLNQVQDPSGMATISHDAAGNVVDDGSFTYTYSDRGRMASVTTPSGTVSYTYNGMDQRASKSGPTALVQTGASYYVYDEAGQLLGEYDANGTPVYETIYLARTPVGALKQTGTAATSDIAVTVYNVYADHIDTPRVITRQDHTIVWRWDAAEAFGATAPDQNPTGQGAFAYNQRFPGQVFDQETGLFQNWNRDYRAAWGRYIQSDPVGLAAGTNTFSYVEGNPLMKADPAGLQANAMSASTLPAPKLPMPSPAAAARMAAPIIELCIANPALCGGAAAGAAGYGAGTLIYPIIEQPLATAIDWCVSAASDTPSPQECDAEWLRARNVCFEWMDELARPGISSKRRRTLLGITGGNMGICMSGQVSEACGGTKVEQPPKSRRRRYL